MDLYPNMGIQYRSFDRKNPYNVLLEEEKLKSGVGVTASAHICVLARGRKTQDGIQKWHD